MASLFELNAQEEDLMQRLFDPETGEIDEAVYEELEKIQEDQDAKRDAWCFFIKTKKAELAAAKEVKDGVNARYKALENEVERIKERFEMLMGGEKFKSAYNSVSYRTSESIVLDEGADIYEVDAKWLNYKDPELNKTAIKDALKSGEKIDHIHVEQKTNMMIR